MSNNLFESEADAIFLDTFIDIWAHIIVWTIITVVLFFFAAGTINVKNKYLVLIAPILWGAIGAIVAFFQGAAAACIVALLYRSIPHAIGIDTAAGIGIGQGLIIVYFHMGRGDFVHR